jgi:cell division protein FtsW (lipid II flippase)
LVPICGTDEVVNVLQGIGRRSNAAPMSALAIIACVVGALAALGLVYVASMDIYLTGFPDSHFTDYDKAADAPKRILVWVDWGFVLLFLVLTVLPINTRRRTVGSFVALVALVLIAIVQWVGIPWYFITHLGLDNGVGG